MFEIERQQWIPRGIEETFDFFSQPENLGLLTPPWLGFEILTPRPIPMNSGAVIEYRIKLFGIPMRWRTYIENWTPGSQFIDAQAKGPYRYWVHTHLFQPMEGGTLITDHVRYGLRFGLLGRIAHAVFVRSMVARIFDYRYEMIRQCLGAEEPAEHSTGGSPASKLATNF